LARGFFIFKGGFAMKKPILTVKEMVEMAMLVALAVVLDFDAFKIQIRSDGGSISLTMIPLFILAFRRGPIKGFIASGIVYGLITCLLDGYGFITYPLDYLLAYGSIGVAGLFKNLIFNKDSNAPIKYRQFVFLALAVVSSVFLRLGFHTISGMVLYETPFWGSVIYNSPVLVSGAIVLTLLIVLYYPLTKINRRFPTDR
jgi:thiamine transporter